jgi:hypothetical protein
MYKKIIVVAAASLAPLCADAGKLNLTQDLGGLDIAVAVEPTDNPTAIKIANKSAKDVACTLSYAGADKGPSSTVKIKAGKSDSLRVAVDASDAPRNGNLKCVESTAGSK